MKDKSMRSKTGKWLLMFSLIAMFAAFGVHSFAGIDRPESTPEPPPKKAAEPAQSFYDQAMRLANEGNTDRAIQVLDGLITAYPNSPYASKARQEIESLRSSTVSTPALPPRTNSGSASDKKSGLVKMVQVPSGRFLMGSPGDEPQRQNDESPQHWVTINKAFLIGATEVTQGQWTAVMGSNPSYFKNCGDECPVEQVNWYEAVSFCNRLSDREGLSRCYQGTDENPVWDRSCNGYRLPSEAEWEYATRAGTTTAFASGDIREVRCRMDSNLDRLGWYCGNANYSTHPVAQKQDNGWGLYDMNGNVWEWVWDWKSDYSSDSITDPQGPAVGLSRVYRGGGWVNSTKNCRSAARNDFSPGIHSNFLGFRLARSLP